MANYKEFMYDPPPEEWEKKYMKFSDKDYCMCLLCGALVMGRYSGEKARTLHDMFHARVGG